MSKCLHDGTASVNKEVCECESFTQGTLDIMIERQCEDGSPDLRSTTHYVKICGSTRDCGVYPIVIDATSGVGTLRLENVEDVRSVLVLVDENEQQMIHQDQYSIGYYVNGEQMEEDYATITHSIEGREHQQVHIVVREMQETSLDIFKFLRDEFKDALPLEEGMQFALCLEGMGMRKEIFLCADNDFHACVTGLIPGEYRIHENGDCAYQTYFRLNGGEEEEYACIQIEQGYNELQVINERRSQSVLTIDKYIRDENGELIKPQEHECFRVRVISDTFDQQFILSCENDFSVELIDLEPGYYDISEISDHGYETSYLVGSQMENDYAHIEIRKCETHSVIIVNSRRNQTCDIQGPLRICKFIRRCDGSLVRPDDGDSFKVMLIGCGIHQTFNLNACNNFCVDLDTICCGEYEIRELDNCDYETSYIVNGGCEKTSAYVCIHEDSHHCVMVINEERNKGMVNICAYIRDSFGELSRPKDGERFLVTLRSFFYRETFVLDQSNEWCMYFDNLKEGSYEIRQRSIEGMDTTYIVNGCKEEKHARFTVENGQCNEVRIVNTEQKNHCGILRISKFIDRGFDEFVKPCADESFEVHVEGPCLDECYRLHSKNNWCILLEGLEFGEYHIRECSEDEHVSYIVNGCRQSSAVVCMGEEDQEVQIINQEVRGGSLELCAWIRNCNGECVRPWGNASFEILVEGPKETNCYTLDKRNGWCILLDDQVDGKYRIIQKESYGYEVSYEVNGEEGSRGIVYMDGQDQSVNIMNTMDTCQGELVVTKYIVDDEGNLMKPCPSDVFYFTIKGNGFKKTCKLNKTNDFSVYFDDLKEGCYEIVEDTQDYDVSYRIQGEIRCDACITLGKEDIQVDILNKERPVPMLCVQQRIRNNGKLCTPMYDECFEFVLKGKNVHEVYTLDRDNDWSICLCDLCNQHYEIKALHVDGNVSYLVDDCLQSDGYFLFNGEDMNVTIIQEPYDGDEVTIRKYVEEDGKLCKPFRWESYEILIEGRNYKQCFTLDCDNDWQITLCDLRAGSYEVKEIGDQSPYFIVNDQQTHKGCFEIGCGDVDVAIVNPDNRAGILSIRAYEDENGCRRRVQCGEYSFTLTRGHEKETYTLDECNDWSLCLDDLKTGKYRIASNDENVSFEINGNVRKHGNFTLGQEDMSIDLIVHCGCHTHDVFIRKVIRDEEGCERQPQQWESFGVQLYTPSGCEEFVLDCSNDWSIQLEGLEEGNYEVKEMDASNCYTQYRINNEIQKKGVFCLDSDTHIDIINELPSQNTLYLSTQIQDCDGEYHQPQNNESFRVQIEGQNFKQRVALNAGNNWSASIENMKAGRYDIALLHSAYENISFLIDGEKTTCASFYMGDSNKEITIIQQEECHRGSLEIMKYKKDSNCGCFVRPCLNEVYRIAVSSDTFEEVLTLDHTNKWRVCLEQLEKGRYQIKELDSEDDVTFIVNGGKESDEAFVDIDGGLANVKVINTPQRTHTGSIEICKYVATKNGIQKPKDQDQYFIQLIGNNETQQFVLSSANHFCVTAQGLADGQYEVIEEQAQGNVQYVVNNGQVSNRGIVQVAQNHNVVQVINQESHGTGKLNILKFIRDKEGRLSRPVGDVSFRIHVSKPGFNEIITLNNANHFQAQLTNLEAGWYVVDELDHEQVTYRVDGGSEVDCGIVQVNGSEHDVWVINTQTAPQKGSITLSKYIRYDMQLEKPQANESFQFHVSRPGFNQVFTLNAENDFTVVISDLDAGFYVINEVNAQNNVRYIVNNGSESDKAVVSVDANENHVMAINERMMETGSIQVTKYIRNEAGQVMLPTGNFETRLHVSRPGFNEFYTLNKGNQWSVTITDLEDGLYVLDEPDYADRVTYVINGGSEIQHGVVKVEGNKNIVQMINTFEPEHDGSIQVTKYIRNEAGMVTLPTGDFETRLHVLGDGFDEYYTLNQANYWTATIQNLADGLYVLEEVDGSARVTYVINGGSEVQDGVVNVQGNANVVQMINTYYPQEIGGMQISKYIRNEAGQLVRPTGDFAVQLRVSSPQFSETYLLNQANQWSVEILNLADGIYVLEEVDATQRVSYIINGGNEVQNGLVNVQGNMNIIQMINASEPQATGSIQVNKYVRNQFGQVMFPSGDFSARLHVSRPGYNQFFTLDQSNHWSVLIPNLENGIYVLDEPGASERVTYVINGGSEVNQGNVNVQGNANVVQMINQLEPQGTGSIQVRKYIRNEAGQLVLPTGDFVARLHVSKLGFNEYYTLDQSNGWTVTISNLTDGTYLLDEPDSDERVSFIVNGGNESNYGSVRVQGNQNTVQMINNFGPQESGSIQVTKYIRNDAGQFMLPTGDFTVKLHVSKPGYNEVFTLDQNNQWTVTIQNLADGMYVLNELDTQNKVSYIIDGGSEVENGVVNIQGNRSIVQMINTLEPQPSGSITITKYIRDESGNLQRPTGNFTTRVQVSRPGYNELFTLNQGNQWTVTIRDLMNGAYMISEPDFEERVSYIINGGAETASGIVNVQHNMNDVQMINTMDAGQNLLRVTKVIRNANGQLVMPSASERFTIQLIGPNSTSEYELNSSNDWTLAIRDIENGCYQLQEVTSNYQVSYIVNDGIESSSACVYMQNGEQSVRIINAVDSTANRLEITKLIKDDNGLLIRPADGDEYTIRVSNATSGYQESFQLNGGNAFAITLHNLEVGTYTIREDGASGFTTTYRVNGGAEIDSANVYMDRNQTNVVEVINEMTQDRNMLEVFKYIQDEAGNFIRPQNNQAFQIQIKGNDFDKRYTLNAQNNWHLVTHELPNGNFTLQELGSGEYHVQYVVNGGSMSDVAAFSVLPGVSNVIEVVNVMGTQRNGRIAMEKRVRNENGELVFPENGQTFTIRLFNNADYDETFSFDRYNDFAQQVDQLPHGTYFIEELGAGSYNVTYMINGQAESNQSLISVQNDTLNNVTIINNMQTIATYRAQQQNGIKIVLE